MQINVAFSGTDKNSLSFTSWMNVKSVTKYALSALYFSADALVQKGIQSIIDEDNQIGTGGAVWNQNISLTSITVLSTSGLQLWSWD